ncbi:MAG TPA: hypothetical protein VFI87_06400 [Hyphomicrobiaceae bacterium]|nr:hypothetical protein [Hyphomicrobiaceae bacterium]
MTTENTAPEELLSDVLDEFLGEEPKDETPATQDDEDPVEGDQEEPEESEDEESEEGEGADEEAEEAAKTPAPNSWSKEDKKAWDALTPEAQQVVLRREQERDKYVAEVGRKIVETRTTVENQARELIAKQAEEYAVQLSAYASRNLPEPPDQRLLYTGNPDDVLVYHRQDAAFRASSAQQQALQQEMAQAQQQAEAARTQAAQAERAVEARRLQELLPEWFDASTGPKLQTELQSIGSELGYPVELMAEASATDILALKKAAEWKAKADRLDRINGRKMEDVRRAKGLPRMVAPGTKPSAAQASKASSEKAWDRVKTTKDPGAMADWLEKSGFM